MSGATTSLVRFRGTMEDTYLNEGAPNTDYQTSTTLSVGYDSGKTSGRHNLLLEEDLFNATPDEGSNPAAGAHVNSAAIQFNCVTPSPQGGQQVFIYGAQEDAADPIAWAGGYPTWNEPRASATTTWDGGLDPPIVVPGVFLQTTLPTVTGPWTLDITQHVQDAIDSRGGILLLLMTVPHSSGGGTPPFGLTDEKVTLSATNVVSSTKLWPLININFTGNDALSKLVNPRPRIRPMIGGRLV